MNFVEKIFPRRKLFFEIGDIIEEKAVSTRGRYEKMSTLEVYLPVNVDIIVDGFREKMFWKIERTLATKIGKIIKAKEISETRKIQRNVRAYRVKLKLIIRR